MHVDAIPNTKQFKTDGAFLQELILLLITYLHHQVIQNPGVNQAMTKWLKKDYPLSPTKEHYFSISFMTQSPEAMQEVLEILRNQEVASYLVHRFFDWQIYVRHKESFDEVKVF